MSAYALLVPAPAFRPPGDFQRTRHPGPLWPRLFQGETDGLCFPGSWSLSGPRNVTGTVGGSLSVQCRYKKEYEAFDKYWCRQPCLPLFSETITTNASGREVRSGRVSILDHPGNLTFTVTLKNLTADDAGKYRCGISTFLMEEGLPGFLPEPFFQVQVFVSSGKALLPLGPAVRGYEGISAEHPRKFRLRRGNGARRLCTRDSGPSALRAWTACECVSV